MQAAWEAARAERLAALQALYAQSLVMIGVAQKAAVVEAEADLSAAVAQSTPWGALATATVRRGLAAAAAADSAQFQTLRAGDAAVYRSEVTRAAAAEERAWVQASSGSGRGRRPRGGSAGSAGRRASTASTHPLVPDGTPAASALPPRLSPFYGPRAVDGLAAARDAGTRRHVVGGIPRVPLAGPLSCALSSARVPYIAERGDGAGAGAAREAAAAATAALASARAAAGAAAAGAAAAASRRGSLASAAAREPREALLALSVMEDLAAQRRHSTGSEGSRRSSWRGGVMPSARALAGGRGGGGSRSASGAATPIHGGGSTWGEAEGPQGPQGGGQEQEEVEEVEAQEQEEEAQPEAQDEAELEMAFLAALAPQGHL